MSRRFETVRRWIMAYARAAWQSAVADWMLIACIVAIAFCVGVGIGGGSVTGFLDRWQTILAGTAAVIAAAATVRKMGETDLGQEKRHRELVALQLRPEALKFQRAAFPAAIYIRSASEDMLAAMYDIRARLAVEPPAETQDSRRPPDPDVDLKLAAILGGGQSILRSLQSEFVVRILDLLSFSEIEARDEAIGRLLVVVQYLETRYPYRDPQAGDYRLDEEAIGEIMDLVSKGAPFARYFADRLMTLEASYSESQLPRP